MPDAKITKRSIERALRSAGVSKKQAKKIVAKGLYDKLIPEKKNLSVSDLLDRADAVLKI